MFRRSLIVGLLPLLAACDEGAGDRPPTRLVLAQPETVGAAFAVEAQLSGDAAAEGFFPGAAPPEAVRTGSLGTWTQAKGDGAVGEIELRFTFPAGARAFVLPIVNGPSVHGPTGGVLSVEIREGAQTLRALQTPSFPQWGYWLIAVAPKDKDHIITIVVRDSGAGWGQWIAVGAPRAVSLDVAT